MSARRYLSSSNMPDGATCVGSGFARATPQARRAVRCDRSLGEPPASPPARLSYSPRDSERETRACEREGGGDGVSRSRKKDTFSRASGRGETWRTSIRAARPVPVCVPEVHSTGRHAHRARRRLDAAQGALRGSKRARSEKSEKRRRRGEVLTFQLSWTSEFLVFRPRACCS